MRSVGMMVEEKVLSQAVDLLGHDPEKNIPRLLGWVEKVAISPNHREQIRKIKNLLSAEDNNWRQLAVRLLKETNPVVRERLAINFFLKACLYGIPQQQENSRRLGVNIPWAILIDPTEVCNLRCTGCWAGKYRPASLDNATLDRVLTEAEELGIYFIVMSGGEPLIRARDIIALAQKHKDQVYHIFTNGTLITEDLAKEMAQTGNITLAISLEGFAENTDRRRGPGTFAKISRAMDILREAGMVFGFSATYTRNNVEELASDEFLDWLVAKGCAFGWFFTYVPVGVDADLEMMATPEQREYMYRRVREFRQTKPIFVADFWNDGEFTGGCIAGGRRYLHINAAGDIEPCAFIHYACGNIKEQSLLEVLRSPLMQAYQKRQPFSENMLRPCPLIDNPEALPAIVQEAGAHPTQTDAEKPEILAQKLATYAETWKTRADRLWETSGHRQAENQAASKERPRTSDRKATA